MSEPAAKRVAEIVEPLCDALAPLLDVPYAMWGHSMGGILAYETTRELRRRHARLPVTLVVAACRAPHVPRRMPPIHALDDESFIAEIRRRYGGLPESTTTDRLSAELLRLMTPTLRADVTLAETYQYIEEPPLICQLVALGGADDAAVTEADLAAWRDHTTGDFEVHRLPGGHFFPDRQRPAIFDILRHALR